MHRSMKRFCVLAAFVLLAGPRVFGFALLGPFEGYQTAALSYNLPPVGTDLGGPKNIGEGYRWNTPVVTYAVDANFLNFFGSNGLVEVDKAFAIMNNLTNVSTYTTNLSEWPPNSSRINHRAEAVGL